MLDKFQLNIKVVNIRLVLDVIDLRVKIIIRYLNVIA